MKKLKVAAAVFGCVLSLVALLVPAFALDPDFDPELTFNTVLPLEPVQLPANGVGLLSDSAVTTASGNVFSRTFGSRPGYTLYFDGVLEYGSDGYIAFRNFINSYNVSTGIGMGYSSSGELLSGVVTVSDSYLAVSGVAVDQLLRFKFVFNNNTGSSAVQSLTQYGFKILSNNGMGKVLGTQIWKFGDSLLSFVKSHFIVMIPLVIWLFVVAFSAIKKIAVP